MSRNEYMCDRDEKGLPLVSVRSPPPPLPIVILIYIFHRHHYCNSNYVVILFQFAFGFFLLLHAYHQNDIQDFYLFFNVFLSRALVLFVLHLYFYSITKFMEWLSSILIHSVFICRRLTFYVFWRPEMTFAPDSFGERKCWISRLLIVLGKEDEEYQGRVTNMLAGC